MSFTTIGSLILRLRREKKINRNKLASGLCSVQTLYEIESDQYDADLFMLEMMLQRLGKSEDKLEIVMTAEIYHMVKLRDLIEESVLRGKRVCTEHLLACYPARTKVDKMYKCRMKACPLYRVDKDNKGALEELSQAIAFTLPDFTYDRMDECLISTVEMENLLAVERIKAEEKSLQEKSEEKRHLELCMNYIEQHFEDEGECAKIYSKCAWLLARIYYQEEQYLMAMHLCEQAMERLRRNTIFYFMLPLLKLITKAEEKMNVPKEKSKWVKYYEILSFLWERYAKKWYPTDLLFHNCYQKEYHLDYELARSERIANGMTQEKVAEGVYQNVESYSRFETGKVSPNRKTFENLMGRLEIEKGRYNGYAVTDSYEMMECRRKLDRLVSHQQFEEALKELKRLKEGINMELKENRRVVAEFELLLEKKLGWISAKEALKQQEEILKDSIDLKTNTLRHIPTRNEVILLNDICANLYETKQEKKAIRLYECALQKMRSSKVNVKYRYRSYSLLLNNYSARIKSRVLPYDVLKNELFCGKFSVLPFCLNNITHALKREGKPEEEWLKWVEYAYYMSNLLYCREVKEAYGRYLESINKK